MLILVLSLTWLINKCKKLKKVTDYEELTKYKLQLFSTIIAC